MKLLHGLILGLLNSADDSVVPTGEQFVCTARHLHCPVHTLQSSSKDRKTSGTAMLFWRSFLSTTFLALFLFHGSQHVCVCVCVCGELLTITRSSLQKAPSAMFEHAFVFTRHLTASSTLRPP